MPTFILQIVATVVVLIVALFEFVGYVLAHHDMAHAMRSPWRQWLLLLWGGAVIGAPTTITLLAIWRAW